MSRLADLIVRWEKRKRERKQAEIYSFRQKVCVRDEITEDCIRDMPRLLQVLPE